MKKNVNKKNNVNNNKKIIVDPFGSYTGKCEKLEDKFNKPVQDADDL